jgi:restriction system protein
MRFFERALKQIIKQTLIRPIKSMFKGWSGEQLTALNMWFSLDDQIYKRFHDIILPSTNGTTQIDHILVSHFGVFIIETKNKTGWIFGSEDQASWTQIVFKEKYSFQNPLRQTFRQRRILSEFIKLDEAYIHPVIFFAGECEFKTQMPSNVIASDLGGYIKKYQERDLSPDKVIDIVNILEKHSKESALTHSDHLRSLSERHNSKTICPKCGSHLIQKKARKGPNEGSTFLGCMNYPQCRFTRNA